ncbi:MAG: nucleotidyltransferase family protein [Candidatus Peregrinibacteria bacterium]|nr:nucleotidyltransferase family protein [Candidatus Peregrinibacteria bacterium]
MTVQALKKQIIPTLQRRGAIKIAIFGSFATRKEKKTSDVDILVKFKNEVTLLQLSNMKLELEDKLERKVDLLTYGGINPRLKKIILQEQKIIYEKRS